MTARSHTDTLAPLFAGLADRGSQVAVRQFGADGSTDFSYAELDTATQRLAAGLRQAGLGPGARILLFAPPSLAWIVVCLGALRARLVPVPLDTQLGEDSLQRIVENSAAEWAVASEETWPDLQAAGFEGSAALLDGASDDAPNWRELCLARGEDAERHLSELQPDDTALLFYTSGTTGPPKGVPLKQRHLAFQFHALSEAGLVRPEDRMLQPLPAHHVYPLVIGTLAPFALGLTVVLPQSLTGPQLLRAIREGEVSIVIGVPRLYAALLAGVERQLDAAGELVGSASRLVLRLAILLRRRLHWRVGRYLLAPVHRRTGGRLRVLASGGAPLDPELAWRLEGLGWQVAIGYGLTETSPLLTLNPPGGNHPESVGRPLDGVELRIDPAAHPAADGADDGDAANGEDADDGGAAAQGPERADVEGEILARGPGVFDGYWQLDDKTEQAFAGDWFRTGDLGCFDGSGRLHVSGRRKTLIVTGAGENVPPEEIESAYERHGDIDEVGVLLDDDELAAVIVPDRPAAGEDEREKAVAEAVRACEASVPSHQRIARFEVDTKPLARTRLGKIQRHRLEERYRELQSGEAESEAVGPADVEDLSPDDRQLLEDERASQTWQVLTDAFPDRPVHPDADLRLDLGIDSLGWLDLTVAIAQRAGVELGEERIAELETVRDLLTEVTESGDGGTGDPQAPLRDPESVLSTDQQRWLQPLPGAAARAARVLRRLNRALMRRGFDLQVSGTAGLPDDGPLVLAPNHASYLDPFAVAAALPEPLHERLYWGGWTGAAFRNRLFRGFSRLAHAIPVDPERAVASSLAFASAVLKQGHGLVWFPEGERSDDGKLGEFRPGLGMLLDQYPEVPVVPVRIAGSHAAWPPGRRWPRRHQIGVRFGEPVSVQRLESRGDADEARDRITDALRDEVAALEPPRPGGRDH